MKILKDRLDNWIIKDDTDNEILRGHTYFLKQVRKAINEIMKAEKMAEQIKTNWPESYFKNKE